MASRRKSFIPCVVRDTLDHMDVLDESVLLPTLKDGDEDNENPQNFREREDSSFNMLYTCTVCSFSANNSETFSCHNTAQHPDKSLNSFQQTKLENRSVLLTSSDLPLAPGGTSGAEDSRKRRTETEAQADSPPESVMLKDEIRAVSVNGTIIIPEPMCHVTPLLQRPPNLSSTPTLAVPLYTNTYNPDLDSNSTLMASFTRFPYPTHAELSWLTAASKHPEEHIRVWFTTQRLKQGITWSPEEVEEARKKLFNGTSPHKRSRLNGHSSLQTPLQRSSEIFKRRPVEKLCESLRVMPPPPLFPENKTSSSAFFVASHFKIPAVASKNKIPVACPKQRLPLTPIVSTNLKRSAVLQPVNSVSDTSNKIKCNDVSLPSARVGRSTVIQTPCFPATGFESLRSSSTCSRGLNGSTADVLAVMERSQFPLLERVKGKSPEQMKLLEESFLRNGFPSFNEVKHLTTSTRLSREEIESWFLERRALRDDLEQALLNSMGSSHMAHKYADAFGSTSLLGRNVFVQTRWPIESQKGFAYTDFGRLFRDRRLDGSSGFLEQEDMFGEQNKCRTADVSKGRLLTKPNSSEIEERYTRMLNQRWPDGNAGDMDGEVML